MQHWPVIGRMANSRISVRTLWLFSALPFSLGLAFPTQVWGQQAPDAGRALQETAPHPLNAPRPTQELNIMPRAETAIAPGGQTVRIQAVRISGNTVFSEAELLTVLGDVAGNYDLAGLQQLAQRLTGHYREHGYPFARALVPAQRLDGGTLELRIVEGRYGQVVAQGALAEQAQPFLSPLQPGAVIASDSLERSVLLLTDQPGVKITPVMRPGQEIGTGDLIVEVSRTPLFRGEVGLDNHGNRYTGGTRARTSVRADSPFLLGDQITLNALYTEEHMWFGHLGYNLPLGSSGWRASLGYAHTYYELGKDFAALDAHGTAKVTSLGLSYPLRRSQRTNFIAGLSFQRKELDDRQGATATHNSKHSEVVPLTLQFDHRDTYGGITWGALAWTAGQLDLDATLTAQDQVSGADTRGSFNKWNLDIARLQSTSWSAFTLFGRLSAQWAGKNLDSSESFLLGGASGVRAYPSGEGNGDEGWLVQLEARWRQGAFEPYVFHDAGEVKINAKPAGLVPPVIKNTRAIAGSGLGLRWAVRPVSLDAAVAWRTQGGTPDSDTEDRNPRVWARLTYHY